MAINGVFEDIWVLINEYFWNAPGYNIINTPVYAITAIFMIYFCYRVVEYINSRGEQKWGENFNKIVPDDRFLLALFPIMLSGGAGRAFNDAFFDPNLKLLVTPWIFFFLIFFTIIMIIISIFVGVKINVDWRNILTVVGIVLLLIFLVPIFIFPNIKGTAGIVVFNAILPVLILYAGIIIVFLIIRNSYPAGVLLTPLLIGILHFFALVTFDFDVIGFFESGLYVDSLGIILTFISLVTIVIIVQKQQVNGDPYHLMTRDNFFTLSAQMFDAVVSYISITFYEYQAKQLVTDLLFTTLGKWSFLTVKLLLVTTLVISLDFFWEDETQAAWIKWAFLIVSVGTSSRDFLRLITAT
ncbi:MAG: DUF63 family protein [Candidatus Hodarchaeales archaeon]